MLFGNPSNTVMQYLVEKNPVLIVYNVLNIFRAIVFYIIFPNNIKQETQIGMFDIFLKIKLISGSERF